MATAHTRAKDSDRNDTCQMLDSALGEGQLSMEEHRQRVSAATKANTLGELRSLVSDLQISNPPVQLPTLKPPALQRGMLIAVAVVLVLVAALVGWGLSGNDRSPAEITSAPSATPKTGEADLLSLGGLTGFLAHIGKQFGDTLGYELRIYPQYAVLTRPNSVMTHKAVLWEYRNGAWRNLGESSIPSGTKIGDLSTFDVQEVLGVLRGAPQTLQVNNPTRTSLTILSANNGSLALTIVLYDGSKGGNIALAADGSVKEIETRG